MHMHIVNIYIYIYIYICANVFINIMNTSLYQFAAHCLHKQAKQWEEKDNDLIVAAKRMARLMMQMSKFAQ